MKLWSNEEIEYLKNNYEIKEAKEIAIYLNRTEKGIQLKAFQLKLYKTNRINLNQTYNSLTVLKKDTNSTKETKYICQCICGAIVSLRPNRISKRTTMNCGKCSRIAKPGEPTINNRYTLCRIKAEERNLEFNLSKEDYKILVSLDCYYCDAKPTKTNIYYRNDGKRVPKINGTTDKTAKLHDVYMNGIDRVDNTKGYIEGNMVPCCKIHNNMKGTLTENDFINACISVAIKQGYKK